MWRDTKLVWQLHRRPGTVGPALLEWTHAVWGADEVDAKLVVGRVGEGCT